MYGVRKESVLTHDVTCEWCRLLPLKARLGVRTLWPRLEGIECPGDNVPCGVSSTEPETRVAFHRFCLGFSIDLLNNAFECHVGYFISSESWRAPFFNVASR